MSGESERAWRVSVIHRNGDWSARAEAAGKSVGPFRSATPVGALNMLRATLPVEAAIRDVRLATDAVEQSLANTPSPRVLLLTTERPDMPDGALEMSAFTITPARVVRVRERVLADGTVTDIPQIEEFGPVLEAAVADGFDACAIRFAHAPRYPIHEQLLFGHAHRAGFASVSASYECAPDATFPDRAELTVLDAALRLTAMPTVLAFSTAVRERLGPAPIRVGTSDGLVDLDTLQPVQFRGSLAAVDALAAEDAVEAHEALLRWPLHAVREHGVQPGQVTSATLGMIVSRLRGECFAELTARGADRDALAWTASAEVGDSEHDITAPDALARVADAPVRRITVEAIEDG